MSWVVHCSKPMRMSLKHRQRWCLYVALLASLFFVSACHFPLQYSANQSLESLESFHPALKVQRAWVYHDSLYRASQSFNFGPVIANHKLIIANVWGDIAVLDRSTGDPLWQLHLNEKISAMPAVNSTLMSVATEEGKVLAINMLTAARQWTVDLPNEILAPPLFVQACVVAKTLDGQVFALEKNHGHEQWHYQHAKIDEVYREDSAPVVMQGQLLFSFANGDLVALQQKDGKLAWQTNLLDVRGFENIEGLLNLQMVADHQAPLVYMTKDKAGVLAYDVAAKKIVWSKSIAVKAKVAIGQQVLALTDANDQVWLMEKKSGMVLWRQPQLQGRDLSAPVLMDHAVVVGDAAGFIYWFSLEDGQLLARQRLGRQGFAGGLLTSGQHLYAFTKDGWVADYIS
jgi:outer membrane protein assembly factor BamB